jgi:hypothetical protein
VLHIDYTAVLIAAAVGLATGAAWHSPFLFGRALSELRQTGQVAQPRPLVRMLGEFARCFVTAAVLGAFIHGFGLDQWTDAVGLGLCVALGFHASTLTGALLYERMPLQRYVIHAGDGIVKIPLMALVIALWQ